VDDSKINGAFDVPYLPAALVVNGRGQVVAKVVATQRDVADWGDSQAIQWVQSVLAN
jgi:hypothetical protein